MAVVAFGPLTISFDGTVLRPRLWTLAQAEWAADLADGTALLELGCGAGQIGLAAAALSGSPVVQVDRDAAACAWAARNAAGNGYASLATQRCGTVAGVLGPEETFSLVVADPPYVPSSEVGRFPADPLGAIDGGADGLAEARAFLTDVAPHLRPGASVLLQVRGQSQADQLADWLAGPAGPGPALALTETRSFAADRAVVRLDRRFQAPAAGVGTHELPAVDRGDHMLQITSAAATQVAQARQSQGLPETFGLRIFGEPRPGGGVELGLAFAEVPAEDDQVSEQEGTRLFLSPEVVEPLAAAALDVEETPEGAKLILTEQGSGLAD